MRHAGVWLVVLACVVEGVRCTHHPIARRLTALMCVLRACAGRWMVTHSVYCTSPPANIQRPARCVPHHSHLCTAVMCWVASMGCRAGCWVGDADAFLVAHCMPVYVCGGVGVQWPLPWGYVTRDGCITLRSVR